MAGFAEDLRRIPMSQGLGATLARAADYAQAQQHGEVALEHLLLALTEDDDAAQVLEASHVDMALLKADVSLYLGGLQGGGQAGSISLAGDLKRILEAAAAAASQGRRREINGAIVLAAIVGDGRSSAAHMLRSQGLTFEEAIKALQRALAATPVTAKPDAGDILANARARVQTRAAPGLPPVAPRPDPVVVPVVPPVAELPVTPPAWPPAVRTSEAVADTSEFVADFDVTRAEGDAAGYGQAHDDPAYQASDEQGYGDASDPGARDFAEADQYAPPEQAAPELPMPMPPMLPPMASVPPPPPSRYAQPQMGSRWPAPVSPAWKDQHDGAPSLPPPLPAAQAGFEHATHVAESYETQPGWPGPDLRGHHPAGGRTEPAFGDHFPPPPSPPLPWPNEPGPDGHGFGQAEGRQAGYRNGSGSESYDPSWPHQDPAPKWSDAGDGSAGYVEAGGPPQVPVEAGGPAGGQSAPRARRRKSADRASAGQMGEGIPRKMRAHVASAVDVRLSKAEFLGLIEGLPDNSPRGGETGCLSVKLRAPDGRFMIDPVTPETQWPEIEAGFGTSDSVSWRWMVTPLNAGPRRLQLVVSARVPSLDGPAIITVLPEQIITVRVGSNYGRALAKLAGWIVIAVIGGVIATYGAGVLEPGIAEVMKALK